MGELRIPENSPIVNRQVVDINLPGGTLVVLVDRDDESLVPDGKTVPKPGDSLLLLSDKDALEKACGIIEISAAKVQDTGKESDSP